MNGCEHDDAWIGEPYGHSPTSWRCTKCGMRLTSGEMELWMRTRQLISKMDTLINKIEDFKQERRK